MLIIEIVAPKVGEYHCYRNTMLISADAVRVCLLTKASCFVVISKIAAAKMNTIKFEFNRHKIATAFAANQR